MKKITNIFILLGILFFFACSTDANLKNIEFNVKTSLPGWTKTVGQINFKKVYADESLNFLADSLLKKYSSVIKSLEIDPKNNLSNVTVITDGASDISVSDVVSKLGSMKINEFADKIRWAVFIEGTIDANAFSSNFKEFLSKNNRSYEIKVIEELQCIYEKDLNILCLILTDKIIICTENVMKDILDVIKKRKKPLDQNSSFVNQLEKNFLSKILFILIESKDSSFSAGIKQLKAFNINLDEKIIKDTEYFQLVLDGSSKIELTFYFIMKSQNSAKNLKLSINKQLMHQIMFLQLLGIKSDINYSKNVFYARFDVPKKTLEQLNLLNGLF